MSGGLGSGAPSVTYGYDDAGRLTTVTTGGVTYAAATYDPAGRRGTVTRYNGGAAGAATTYGYDAADRPTRLTTAQGGTTPGDFGYAYARNGQVTQAVEAIGGTGRCASCGRRPVAVGTAADGGGARAIHPAN